MGGAVFPPCCLTWGQTMVEVIKTMVTSFKRSCALPHSVPLTLQQATADPRLCWRLLDTHGQVWVSLLRGHCSFLLGPGVHKVLFVPKSLFPWPCVSSGSSMVRLMEISTKRAYAITRSAAPRAPALWQATADPYLCKRHSNWGNSKAGLAQSVVSPGAHKVLTEPSKCLWQVWGLILWGCRIVWCTFD